MKKLQVVAVALLCFSGLTAQNDQVDFNHPSALKMEVDYGAKSAEISDILQFEGIDYQKLKFEGEALKGKSYKLTVKEIWNGELKSESTVLDSRELGVKNFETLKESLMKMRIISKRTHDNKLRMVFKFPRFSITKEYDAIDSDDYSLRNIAEESNLEPNYDEPFYLLAYILPYEREDGSKSWCEVGTAGKDLENWGKRFGIEHYLLFEMTFE